MDPNPTQLGRSIAYKFNPKGTLYFHAHYLAFITSLSIQFTDLSIGAATAGANPVVL